MLLLYMFLKVWGTRMSSGSRGCVSAIFVSAIQVIQYNYCIGIGIGNTFQNIVLVSGRKTIVLVKLPILFLLSKGWLCMLKKPKNYSLCFCVFLLQVFLVLSIPKKRQNWDFLGQGIVKKVSVLVLAIHFGGMYRYR